jgi:guanylate kinase
MKYIIFTGTSGSGKDSIIDHIVERAEAKKPGQVRKAWYYTTRNYLRSGEKKDHRFLTDEEFNNKLDKGEIIFPAKNADYQVGYPFEELDNNNVVVMNINADAARELKAKVESKGGQVFMVYLDAPKEQRIERLRFRENMLLYEPVEEKINNDIVESGLEKHGDFNLVLENKDGFLETNKNRVWEAVEKFIG